MENATASRRETNRRIIKKILCDRSVESMSKACIDFVKLGLLSHEQMDSVILLDKKYIEDVKKVLGS